MRLRFFGRLRDAVGADELDLPLPPEVRDSEQARAWLGRDHPALLDGSVRIALAARRPRGAQPLAGAHEIAFLPPVSGG